MRDKSSAAEISVTKDGPYLVAGELPLAKATIGANDEGESIRWEWGNPYPEQKNFALCRCGHSAHKPFCDGTHAKIGFDGTETASREPYALCRCGVSGNKPFCDGSHVTAGFKDSN